MRQKVAQKAELEYTVKNMSGGTQWRQTEIVGFSLCAVPFLYYVISYLQEESGVNMQENCAWECGAQWEYQWNSERCAQRREEEGEEEKLSGEELGWLGRYSNWGKYKQRVPYYIPSSYSRTNKVMRITYAQVCRRLYKVNRKWMRKVQLHNDQMRKCAKAQNRDNMKTRKCAKIDIMRNVQTCGNGRYWMWQPQAKTHLALRNTAHDKSPSPLIFMFVLSIIIHQINAYSGSKNCPDVSGFGQIRL